MQQNNSAFKKKNKKKNEEQLGEKCFRGKWFIRASDPGVDQTLTHHQWSLVSNMKLKNL